AITCTQFSANWSASPNTANYFLDVATDNGFTNLVVNGQNVLNVTTYMVTGLLAGNTYYYRVRASNVCGTSTSSNTITVVMPPAIPDIPAAQAGSDAQCNQIKANWSPVANVVSYYLDVSTVNTFASFVAGFNNRDVGNVTSFDVVGLLPGVTYYYRVRAGNGCGTSNSSPTITYATLPATPSAPVAIAGSAATCTGITANWNASANASGYLLDVSTINTFSSFVTGYNGLDVGNTTTYNVTGLTTGVTYYYRVRAVNSCGTSGYSNVITYATSPATPAQPGAISGPNDLCINRTGLVYSVSAVPNATSYNWTLPAGFSITAGANTNSITVSTNAGAVSGNITVSAVNSCGTSAVATLAVVVSITPPATPAAILGNFTICPITTEIYSVDPVPGATSYLWAAPAGWPIQSGQGTVSVSVQVDGSPSSGTVTVQAVNGCTPLNPARSQNINTSSFTDVNAGPDLFVCAGTTTPIQLNATSDPASSTASNEISWNNPPVGNFNPNGNRANPTYT
ncbi:MAG TPA: fibronectin type III domain-containing protein, partial [Phnomibacter sp.]|nr:fibronectin type III domain-containing protein [Phnomibacter sp.]